MAVYESLLLNTAVPQIQAAQAGDSYVMVVNATTPALRITQTGTGNALEVEDSSNPDATPFVVSAAGDVGIGTNAPAAKIEVSVGRAATVNSGIFSTSGTGVVGDQNRVLVKNVNTAAGANYGVGIGGYLEASASNKASLLLFYDSGTATTEGARLDSSGNLGLGVTPKTDWSTDYKAMQFGASGALSGHTSTSLNFTILATNQYINSAGTAKFINDGYAPRYLLRGDTGEHYWYTTNTSTAGQTVSNTQAMTLDASGNLGVGTTSPKTNGSTFATLTLNGSNGGAQHFTTADSTVMQLYNDANSFFLNAASGKTIVFQNASTELARITSGGDFRVKGAGTAGSTDAVQFSGSAPASSLLLNSSGNLGLGVTPSAWVDRTALEGSYGGALSFDKVYLQTALSSNCNYNGTNWLYKLSGWGATRYELGDISNGSAFHKWYVAPSGTAGNAISFTQAMTLDASGRLLVGTTTSSNRTITVGAASASIALADANGGIYFGATGTPVGSGGFGENAGIARAGGTNFHISGSVAGDLCIAPEGTKAILFGTSASASSVTERARITSGGDLFVGTTVDTWTTTKGFYCFYQSATNVTRDGAEAMNLNRLTNDGTIMGFRRSGTEVGTISVTTTATAYNTSSDYRLKDNPQPLTTSGAFIDALKPKTWDWKADGSKGVGFIAHEAQEVSPSSVVGAKDAVDADGKPVMQAMEYGSAEFIANIVAELQSLRARVAQLEQGA